LVLLVLADLSLTGVEVDDEVVSMDDEEGTPDVLVFKSRATTSMFELLLLLLETLRRMASLRG
jgi:hypothetical protein